MSNNIVKIKKFKYVLDWYDITEVEINLDDFAFFEMQHRCGTWYLMHYVMEGDSCRSKNVFEHDFQPENPRDAIEALGGKLKKFSSLHNGGTVFIEALKVLIAGRPR